MQITNISDAKASLSQLIKNVQENDEDVIIGKAGKPIAVLSKYKEDDSPRKLGGSWEGKVIISDDFDHPADAIVDSFYDSKIFPEKQ